MSKSVFDQQGYRALTFALARLSCSISLQFQRYKYFRFRRLFPVIGRSIVFELAMVDSPRFAVGKQHNVVFLFFCFLPRDAL